MISISISPILGLVKTKQNFLEPEIIGEPGKMLIIYIRYS